MIVKAVRILGTMSAVCFVVVASASGDVAAEPGISPCGGKDQRACCALERNGPACDAGLVEQGPCVGNCKCARSLASSIGMCVERIKPPTVQLTPVCPGNGQTFSSTSD